MAAQFRLTNDGEADVRVLFAALSLVAAVLRAQTDGTPPPLSPGVVYCAQKTGTVEGIVWAFDPTSNTPPHPFAGAVADWFLNGRGAAQSALGDGRYSFTAQYPGDYAMFLERSVPGTSGVPSVYIRRSNDLAAGACRVDLVASFTNGIYMTYLPFCGPEHVQELLLPFAQLAHVLGEDSVRPEGCAFEQVGQLLQATQGGMGFYDSAMATLDFTDGWRHWRVQNGNVTEEDPAE